MRMEYKYLKSTPIPLQIHWPEGHGGELQIVKPPSLRPQLPPDWTVVERPRPPTRTSGRVDKYYIEPGTGRLFRSLISVHRYLTGEPPTRREQAIRMQIFNSDQKYAYPDFRLPEGWIVRKVPRKNVHYTRVVDKYYIEPGTGYRFRSLVSVERYLKATGRDSGVPKAIEFTNRFSDANVAGEGSHLEIVPVTNHSKLMTNRDKTGLFNAVSLSEPKRNFANRPEKVNWVFTGPGGNMFRPYVCGSVVPGSVREQWSEAFVSLIQDRS